jgi:hypothetical protein
MLVLFARRGGCDEVRDGLGEIAVVLSPVLVDRLLYMSSLFRCPSSALLVSHDELRTIVKPSQTYLQTEECRQAVLCL